MDALFFDIANKWTNNKKFIKVKNTKKKIDKKGLSI